MKTDKSPTRVPTISARHCDNGALGWSVEVIVSGIESEAQAVKGMELLLAFMAGDEIKDQS